jgi:hypothetical protein
MAGTINYDFLNWEKMAQINDEKIRADLWKLEFTRKPAGIPFPPDDYLQARMLNYQFSPNGEEPSVVPTTIRGFTVLQSTPQGDTSASLSISFEDFSDQSLTYCFSEWKRGMGDYQTKMSLPRAALDCDIRITITDVNKVPIRTIDLYRCLPQFQPFDEHGSGSEGGDFLSQNQVTFMASMWRRTILNVK